MRSRVSELLEHIGVWNHRPFDVSEIRRPSDPVDSGCNESRVHEIKVIGRKGERAVQIVYLSIMH